MARFLKGETGVIIKITIDGQILEEKVDKEEACMVGFQKSSDPVDFIIKLAELGAKISSDVLDLKPTPVSYSGSIIAKTQHLGEHHAKLPENLSFPTHLIEVMRANEGDPYTRSFSEYLNFAEHCQCVARSIEAGRTTKESGKEQIEMFREHRLMLGRHLTKTK